LGELGGVADQALVLTSWGKFRARPGKVALLGSDRERSYRHGGKGGGGLGVFEQKNREQPVKGLAKERQGRDPRHYPASLARKADLILN